MKLPTEKHLDDLKKDKFGYKALSKRLLDNVLLDMELPNCFGFYGNWGSGKSTMINYIKRHLEDNVRKRKDYDEVTTVYFEPWKYEYSDTKDLLFALLNSIKQQTGLSDSVWKDVLISVGVIAVGVLNKMQLTDLKRIEEDQEIIEGRMLEEHQRWVDSVEGFRGSFDQVIKKALKKNKTKKIIIFIDDLDRCLPENAISLLEAIKNFLYVENVLFVLAIDRRVVSEMIEKKYGLHHGYGDEYLMKIVQYYYELPSVDQVDIIEEVLGLYKVNLNDNDKRYISRVLKEERIEPRVAKHILHQFGMGMALSSDVRQILKEDPTSGIALQYVFVSSFLLTMYPKLFSSGNPLELLRSINTSTGTKARGNYQESELKKAKEMYSIDEETRSKLESFWISYPIRSGKEGSPPKQINDIQRLSRAMKALRVYI